MSRWEGKRFEGRVTRGMLGGFLHFSDDWAVLARREKKVLANIPGNQRCTLHLIRGTLAKRTFLSSPSTQGM